MKEVTLSVPIRVNGKMTSTLSVRPATVGDEEDAQALAVELGRPFVALTAEICLFAALTGVSYDDLRALPSSEYARLRSIYHEVSRPRPTQEENGENSLVPPELAQ